MLRKVVAITLVITVFISCRYKLVNCQSTTTTNSLPPNVTNILEQLLEQALANQNAPPGNNNGNGNNGSLIPSNLSEIVRIFVQFLVAIFNAFTRIFSQSPMFRDDVVFKNLNDSDSSMSMLSAKQNDIIGGGDDVSLERILQERKQKFQQIFDTQMAKTTSKRLKRDLNDQNNGGAGAGAGGWSANQLDEDYVTKLLLQFTDIQSINRYKRNIEQVLNLNNFGAKFIEKLLKQQFLNV